MEVLEELRSNPTISIETYARIMGISKSFAYLLARQGEIPVIRMGRQRVRVPSIAVLRMLEAAAEGALPPAETASAT